MTVSFRRAFPVLVFALICAAQVSAQSYKVELAAVPVPLELSEAVRVMFLPQTLRVSGPDGLVCEIWVKTIVPSIAGAEIPGVIHPQIQEGTLIAVIRFPSDLKDFRRQTIKAGVYTLRYARSPVNANHQGVAPHRDFLLAIPATADQDPAAISETQTIELSKKSTTTNHASVWCLMPGDGNGASPAPATVKHDEENDFWIVNFSISLYSKAVNAIGYPRMGLVVAGFGPEV